jgi:acetolactate synthase I/III small subunit
VAITSTEDRMEIRQIAQDFRARIVDVHTDALMFEITGGSKKIDAFIEQMKQYGILELMRTGQVALTRSAFDPKVKAKAAVERAA